MHKPFQKFTVRLLKMADGRVPFLSLCLLLVVGASGMLYPQDNEHRLVKELNGLWLFRADVPSSRDEGFAKKWYERPLDEVSALAVMQSFWYVHRM